MSSTLDPATAQDPLALLLAWRDDALAAKVVEPDAMTLATSTPDGMPSARIVLFRGVRHGGIRFFTNYDSRKGEQLAANPRAALLFFWGALERQARIEGAVERVPAEESDEYFRARPRGHQLNAWASPQSTPIPGREVLLARYADAEARYQGRDVPRPEYWGGYRVIPARMEFWSAGKDRLHDRVLFVRREGGWDVTRLSP